MNNYSIKKTFPDIGQVEFKVATTRDEVEQAMALVYREYVERGFISPDDYKSGLRVTLPHLIPGTITFVGIKDKRVVITDAVIPDSTLGLPLDMGYKCEANKLRRSGRKICEGAYLAMDSKLFGKGLFSMYNFKKLDFMFTLFKFLFQYVLFYAKYDDICIVTNPKYMIFRFLPFKVLGPVKYYGYDRLAIKKKAAVFKVMNIKEAHKCLSGRIGMMKMFMATRIPKEAYTNAFVMDYADLHYFFVEKSDLLKKASRKEKEYIRKTYGLSTEEFNDLLGKGQLKVSLKNVPSLRSCFQM